jgi:ComF family protein
MPSHLSHIPDISRALLDWLLPSRCALCRHTGDAAICAHCRARYLAATPARCPQCALLLPVGASGHCGACLRAPPAFDAAVAACDYAAPADGLIQALKFHGELALAPCFARLLRDAVERAGLPSLPSLLLPVPLGPRRLRERGFNQALEIARPLGRMLGVQAEARLAVRVRDTAAQARLALDEREANMRRAFAMTPAGAVRVRGLHVGLVDDVLTTGSTLDALAALLKRYGAAQVTALVVARTP